MFSRQLPAKPEAARSPALPGTWRGSGGTPVVRAATHERGMRRRVLLLREGRLFPEIAGREFRAALFEERQCDRFYAEGLKRLSRFLLPRENAAA